LQKISSSGWRRWWARARGCRTWSWPWPSSHEAGGRWCYPGEEGSGVRLEKEFKKSNFQKANPSIYVDVICFSSIKRSADYLFRANMPIQKFLMSLFRKVRLFFFMNIFFSLMKRSFYFELLKRWALKVFEWVTKRFLFCFKP
jgi:hypothetical protein